MRAVKAKKWLDIKVGDTVEITTDNYNNYSVSKGDEVVVTWVSPHNGQVNINTPSGTIGIPASCWKPLCYTKEAIEEKIAVLEADVKEYKDMLTWMKKTKNDKYDATEFKVWSTLQTLDSAKTDVEKAKIIANLIKG